MYDYDYIAGETTKAAANVAGTLIWTIIAFIIAIAAGIMVYFMFVKSDKQVSENLKKLKDLLDFKTMLIEPIWKNTKEINENIKPKVAKKEAKEEKETK